MNAALLSLLTALLLFQSKHFLCDFILQSNWQFSNKGSYGHPAGFVHAGLHTIFSVPAMMVLTSSWSLIGALAAAEFVIHYHCDWAKCRVDAKLGVTTKDWLYWVIFGLDQYVHQLTYVGMLFVLGG